MESSSNFNVLSHLRINLEDKQKQELPKWTTAVGKAYLWCWVIRLQHVPHDCNYFLLIQTPCKPEKQTTCALQGPDCSKLQNQLTCLKCVLFTAVTQQPDPKCLHYRVTNKYLTNRFQHGMVQNGWEQTMNQQEKNI